MSVVFRFLALLLIVVALLLLGADVVTSLEKGTLTVRSIGQAWALLDAHSLKAFKAWASHTLPGPMPGWVYSVLSMWSWGVTGALGVVLGFLAGRRHASG